MEKDSTYYLLVGTYTRTKNDGIHVYSFNPETGEAEFMSKTTNVKDPSFLTSSPDKKLVFAVNESGEKSGDHVSSFRFNAQTGALQFVDRVTCGGIHPCYISADASAGKVFVANYTSGSLSEVSVNAMGVLNSSIYTIQYKGKSVHPERQSTSHIHAAVFSPGYHHLFVTDLGSDKIKTYKIKNDILKLVSETNVTPGSGPRHLVFNNAGTYAYLILELNATVAVFKHINGHLENIQIVKLESEDFKGMSSAADIHLSHDENFLYASNRGLANEIVVFSLNKENGRLTYVDRTSSLGITPRNFVIDPSDKYLLVGNQESNDIFIFKRDLKTGKLTYTEKKIEVEAPVCLHLIEAE